MKNEGIKQTDPGSIEFSWDWAKDKIYPCLAPHGWQKLKGRQVVSRDFLDLSVYYYIRAISEGMMTSIWITKEILDSLGV